jgi:hypothetical protein
MRARGYRLGQAHRAQDRGAARMTPERLHQRLACEAEYQKRIVILLGPIGPFEGLDRVAQSGFQRADAGGAGVAVGSAVKQLSEERLCLPPETRPSVREPQRRDVPPMPDLRIARPLQQRNGVACAPLEQKPLAEPEVGEGEAGIEAQDVLQLSCRLVQAARKRACPQAALINTLSGSSSRARRASFTASLSRPTVIKKSPLYQWRVLALFGSSARDRQKF